MPFVLIILLARLPPTQALEGDVLRKNLPLLLIYCDLCISVEVEVQVSVVYKPHHRQCYDHINWFHSLYVMPTHRYLKEEKAAQVSTHNPTQPNEYS